MGVKTTISSVRTQNIARPFHSQIAAALSGIPADPAFAVVSWANWALFGTFVQPPLIALADSGPKAHAEYVIDRRIVRGFLVQSLCRLVTRKIPYR